MTGFFGTYDDTNNDDLDDDNEDDFLDAHTIAANEIIDDKTQLVLTQDGEVMLILNDPEDSEEPFYVFPLGVGRESLTKLKQAVERLLTHVN